jgi:hypothetical protein
MNTHLQGLRPVSASVEYDKRLCFLHDRPVLLHTTIAEVSNVAIRGIQLEMVHGLGTIS